MMNILSFHRSEGVKEKLTLKLCVVSMTQFLKKCAQLEFTELVVYVCE